jgi:hypothetical protein
MVIAGSVTVGAAVAALHGTESPMRSSDASDARFTNPDLQSFRLVAARGRSRTNHHLLRIAQSPGNRKTGGLSGSGDSQEWRMIASVKSLRELAIMQPGVPVLSVHVRTDPRDPANTAATPKWLVELRNNLREVADAANAGESRSERLARRELYARVERAVLELHPRERARGLAWFITRTVSTAGSRCSAASSHPRARGRPSVCPSARRLGRPLPSDRAGVGQRRGRSAAALGSRSGARAGAVAV